MSCLLSQSGVHVDSVSGLKCHIGFFDILAPFTRLPRNRFSLAFSDSGVYRFHLDTKQASTASLICGLFAQSPPQTQLRSASEAMVAFSVIIGFRITS